MDKGEILDIAEKDEHFHDAIFRATKNERLISIINNLREQFYRYRLEYVKDILCSAHAHSVPVIASSHDFQKTPGKEEILSRLKKMDALGADILKIAVMPLGRADVITLLDATQEADASIDKPIVTMAMGRMGLISRLCGEAFGSALTFGSVGAASAPGQINAEDLREILALIHANS